MCPYLKISPIGAPIGAFDNRHFLINPPIHATLDGEAHNGASDNRDFPEGAGPSYPIKVNGHYARILRYSTWISVPGSVPTFSASYMS